MTVSVLALSECCNRARAYADIVHGRLQRRGYCVGPITSHGTRGNDRDWALLGSGIKADSLRDDPAVAISNEDTRVYVRASELNAAVDTTMERIYAALGGC